MEPRQRNVMDILTVEDPSIYCESKKCLINQRELGEQTLSFANALRSALREIPTSSLIGEMRDLETIGLALTAAETGHLPANRYAAYVLRRQDHRPCRRRVPCSREET